MYPEDGHSFDIVRDAWPLAKNSKDNTNNTVKRKNHKYYLQKVEIVSASSTFNLFPVWLDFIRFWSVVLVQYSNQ